MMPTAAAYFDAPQSPAGWLNAALSEPTAASARHPAAVATRAAATTGVARALSPLLDHAWSLWQRRIDSLCRHRLAQVVDLQAFSAAWFADIEARLASLGMRTFALELQVARLSGELSGDTPERRLASFYERLSQPGRLSAFLSEYAALAGLWVNAITQSLDFGIEVLTHVRDDAAALACGLGVDCRSSRLLALRAEPGGDRHAGGRSVLRAQFESGQRLIYKPRPCGVEQHFGELLAWISARDARFQFRVPPVLDIDRHGWFEFVEGAPCTTLDEVTSFFRRHGEYLALLSVIGAVDLHHENVVAVGAYPVLLDLEALFHPVLGDACAPLDGDADATQAALMSSVLRVGLLPWNTGGQFAFDVGGITAPVRQRSSEAMLTLADRDTERMRFVYAYADAMSTAHRVRLDGVVIEPVQHVDAIETGLTRMYDFLIAHREALGAVSGPLHAFADDDARFIVRATRTYASLLQNSLHPDLLRSVDDRRALVCQLDCSTEDRELQTRDLHALVASERRDVGVGDIPMFRARIGGVTVTDSASQVIDGLLDKSALQRACERLSELSAADLELQRWIVRTSMAGSAKASAAPPRRRSPGRVRHEAGATLQRRALQKALCIGERLSELAIRSGTQANWLGVTTDSKQAHRIEPLGGDLYDGLPGVALFLAHLAEVSHEERYLELAQAAARHWIRDILHPAAAPAIESEQCLGAYTGLGGSVYVLSQLSTLWRQPQWLAEADALVDRMAACVGADRNFDVLGGAAGGVAALLALHATRESPKALRAAIACGDHLLSHAQPQAQGCAWSAPDGVALGGFSHGTAGIAWALDKLARATGLQRFATTASDALAYDNSLFDSTAGNWRDLSPDEESGPGAAPAARYRCTWCHGAAGIGMGRLDAVVSRCGTPVEKSLALDAERAAIAVARHGMGANHGLCHGDLGNIELLLRAGRHDSGWRDVAHQRLTAVLDDMDERGWRCGAMIDAEVPGLMNGLSGMGYGLLRTAFTDVMPSVLLMAPARGRRADGPRPARRCLPSPARQAAWHCVGPLTA